MKKWLVALGFVWILLPGCSRSVKVRELGAGEVLFSKGKECYFYDLKITDSYYLFADDKGDTILRVYQKDRYSHPLQVACREVGEKGLWKPMFTKEVREKVEKDVVSAIDLGLYERRFALNADSIQTQTTVFRNSVVHSVDYNGVGKEIYASPLLRSKLYPYFYFNQEDGYYWVDPSPEVKKVLPAAATAFACNLCVNEKAGCVVAAYRFTNNLTFYDLEGKEKTTVWLGYQPIAPSLMRRGDDVDVASSVKCFTYVCGTPRFVYCVYDGTADFSARSSIAVFKWDGTHVATWLADRNLRAIATDASDQYLLAISSNDSGGQDILKYALPTP